MVNNFQVETFDDKDLRDERYDELRKRMNADGTIGRPGLVKLSSVKAIEGGAKIFPNYASRLDIRHGKKGAVIVHGRLRLSFLTTWSIAYPRLLPPPRLKTRKIHRGPNPKRQRRLERFRKRHPRDLRFASMQQKLAYSCKSGPRIRRDFVKQSRLNGEKKRT